MALSLMSNDNLIEVKEYLEEQYHRYCTSSFIDDDPIQIPHLFDSQQNVEIAGFFAATFAWGQRKTIISKSKELIARMDNNPHEFICSFTEADLKSLVGFRHRTFGEKDAVSFVRALSAIYRTHDSMDLFLGRRGVSNPVDAIRAIRSCFLETEGVYSTSMRHVANPDAGSAAKRLNMFFRWMVRSCRENVDFGLWQSLQPKDLLIPLDLHVGNVSRELGLLQRRQNDFKAVQELTEVLRTFDPLDPIRYDFALFSIGVSGGIASGEQEI